jgi:hypothetical protein
MSRLLTDDARECVVAALPKADWLALRGVDVAWRDAVDAHVRGVYAAPLEDMLAHMRIRGQRRSWLLRYALAPEYGPEDHEAARYVCATCGCKVHAVGMCDACLHTTRRVAYNQVMRRVLCAATTTVFVLATVLLVALGSLWGLAVLAYHGRAAVG